MRIALTLAVLILVAAATSANAAPPSNHQQGMPRLSCEGPSWTDHRRVVEYDCATTEEFWKSLDSDLEWNYGYNVQVGAVVQDDRAKGFVRFHVIFNYKGTPGEGVH